MCLCNVQARLYSVLATNDNITKTVHRNCMPYLHFVILHYKKVTDKQLQLVNAILPDYLYSVNSVTFKIF